MTTPASSMPQPEDNPALVLPPGYQLAGVDYGIAESVMAEALVARQPSTATAVRAVTEGFLRRASPAASPQIDYHALRQRRREATSNTLRPLRQVVVVVDSYAHFQPTMPLNEIYVNLTVSVPRITQLAAEHLQAGYAAALQLAHIEALRNASAPQPPVASVEALQSLFGIRFLEYFGDETHVNPYTDFRNYGSFRAGRLQKEKVKEYEALPKPVPREDENDLDVTLRNLRVKERAKRKALPEHSAWKMAMREMRICESFTRQFNDLPNPDLLEPDDPTEPLVRRQRAALRDRLHSQLAEFDALARYAETERLLDDT